MKKILRTLFFMAICAFCVSGFIGCNNGSEVDTRDQQTVIDVNPQELDFYPKKDGSYEVGGGKATLLENIVIPSTYKGKAVTSIKSEAFKDYEALQHITIPDGITSIGDNAFNGCISLEEITIPNSVTSISDSALYNCTAITNATIGNNVQNICSLLNSCTALESVTVNKNNENYSSQDGFLYDKTKLKIIFAPRAIRRALSLPNSIRRIDNYAFQNCKDLIEITIPNNVIVIGAGAFCGCNALQSIIIPNSVTCIETEAFSGCSTLHNILLSNGLTQVGKDAFRDCTNIQEVENNLIYVDNVLIGIKGSPKTQYNIRAGTKLICDWALFECHTTESITIPDSVQRIGQFAFGGCISLQNVVIPNNVTVIGWSAFTCCTSLKSITIPVSVTSIGQEAFWCCESLATITYQGTKAQWEQIGKGLSWNKHIPTDCVVQWTNGTISIADA